MCLFDIFLQEHCFSNVNITFTLENWFISLLKHRDYLMIYFKETNKLSFHWPRSRLDCSIYIAKTFTTCPESSNISTDQLNFWICKCSIFLWSAPYCGHYETLTYFWLGPKPPNQVLIFTLCPPQTHFQSTNCAKSACTNKLKAYFLLYNIVTYWA